MSDKLTRTDCILLLRRQAELMNRFPKKSDFDHQTVGMIKSYFGPWPRALEAAGVKEPDRQRSERRREKRRRARVNQMRYRREHSKEEKEK